MRHSCAAIVAWCSLSVWLTTGHAQQRSGFLDMSKAVQALQADDNQNPGLLWVEQGQQLWSASCQQCHGQAGQSMQGAAARFPKFSASLGRPVSLIQQIEQCRVRARLPAVPTEHSDMLALAAYVGLQSRGSPIVPDTHPASMALRQRGQALYTTRMGQLDLSCAHCHDQHAGSRLGSALIPQGHANGYPIYRLEWQSMGSLQRRLRNCLVGVRAEPFADQAVEWTALELHLMWRATGMPMETPAVRP